MYGTGPRADRLPPPKGWGGPLGTEFLLEFKISVGNPCYGAPIERFPSGGPLSRAPYSKQSFKEPVCHIVS